MVYFMACKSPYPATQIAVYAKFLDKPDDWPFDGIPFEADPSTLDLHAVEKEYLAKGRTAMCRGYRVIEDTAPKKLLWPCGKRPLPDVIPATIPAYSARLCDLIEQFEPSVHQFLPVDIYKKRDGAIEATYYWFNPCNRIDSVNEHLTTYKWKLDYTGKHGFWDAREVENAKLVFSKEKVASRHFWYDPNILVWTGPYCSDAFAEAAFEADFSGLSLTSREEA